MVGACAPVGTPTPVSPSLGDAQRPEDACAAAEATRRDTAGASSGYMVLPPMFLALPGPGKDVWWLGTMPTFSSRGRTGTISRLLSRQVAQSAWPVARMQGVASGKT